MKHVTINHYTVSDFFFFVYLFCLFVFYSCALKTVTHPFLSPRCFHSIIIFLFLASPHHNHGQRTKEKGREGREKQENE